MHLMTLDKSRLKINLESIIESKTPLMINSEFWDRFRALVVHVEVGFVNNGQTHIYLA